MRTSKKVSLGNNNGILQMKKASLVITRYSESNQEVEFFIKELLKQEKIFFDVFFYDQKKSDSLRDFIKNIKSRNLVFHYKKIIEKPLGEIRDLGLQESNNDVVIFTDIDMSLDPNWAYYLVKGFAKDTHVAITGGRIEINYLKKSKFYHTTAFIKSFYGYLNLGRNEKFCFKVNGGNIALHKNRLGDNAFFKKDLGRQKGKLLAGEETELCYRAHRDGLKILYIPGAVVYHRIDQRRMSVRHILRSIFYQGKNKAISTNKITPANKSQFKLLDKVVILLLLPVYMAGFLSWRLKKWLF